MSRRWQTRRSEHTSNQDSVRVVRLAEEPSGQEPDVHTKRKGLTEASVCVIGGGPSGLACCRRLCDAGLDVTLVQESRGLGGKMCTKFVNGPDDPSLHFDMGVQMLRPLGALAEELDGVVEPWPLAGRFKQIRCTGGWEGWDIASIKDLPTDGFVVGVPSMSKVGRHLASKCKDLTIHLDRSGQVIGRDPSGRWEVEWKREAPTLGQIKYRPELKDATADSGNGSYDAVVLAFEANKILKGCQSGYKMVRPSATPQICAQLSRGKTKTSQLWNLMVAFDEELPMPWDAACIEGHRSLSWVAVNSSKPQRARKPMCFQLFSTREWADWKQWSRKEVEKDLLLEFLEFLETVLRQKPPKPCFVLSGRWGNNTETVLTGIEPEGQFPMRSLGHYNGKGRVVVDAAGGMAATGDWARGYSVSDAYSAGLETAEEVLREQFPSK